MRKWFKGVTLTLCLMFVATSAIAEEVALDPVEVVGFGLTKAEARAEAKQLRDDAVEAVEDSLTGDAQVVGVISTYEWDGVSYEISFQVIVDIP